MRLAGFSVAVYAGIWLALVNEAASLGIRATSIALCLAGVAGGLALLANLSQGFIPACIFVAATLGFGLFLFAARIAFIVQHGGMDSPETPGSPVAFLLGWAFEQAAFTFPSACLALGLWHSWRMASLPPPNKVLQRTGE